MQPNELLNALFPDGHEARTQGDVISGWGRNGGRRVAVIGTVNHAAIGVETALTLADHVLHIVQNQPGLPILLLVDNQGQRLSRRDELLGNNRYLAHLAKSLEVARRRGHTIISLVYDEAVSGGFLAAGMIANQIYALPEAQIRVMNLPAMSRITQIPLERLQSLCQTSAIFAPGVESFIKLGIVEQVWHENLAESLAAALDYSPTADQRSELGHERKGRVLAAVIAKRVREAAPRG